MDPASIVVGNATAGVLIGGISGSGKSTTAIACVEAGFDYAGDDYVLASLDPRQTAHCLYTTAKVAPGALARFPALASSLDEDASSEEKAVLQLSRDRSDQIAASIPIVAAVLPRVRGSGPTELRPLSDAEAVLALGPSTILQLPHRSHDALELMTELLKQIPSYRLELGKETRDAVPLLRTLIGDS